MKGHLTWWMPALLLGALLLLPGLSLGQKGSLKGQPATATPDSASGKGALKGGVAVKDTLKGGDGFIPRTVIDSFPRQPEEKVASGPKTSVRRADLTSSADRIEQLRIRIAEGDSMLAMRRMDPLPEWPEERVSALSDAITAAKAALADAERRHAALVKRYDSAFPNGKEAAPARPSPKEPAIPAPAANANPVPPAPASGGNKANLKGK